MRSLFVPLLFIVLSGVSGVCGALTLEIIRALIHWPRIRGGRSWRGFFEFVKHELS